jgi:hypothetical protein
MDSVFSGAGNQDIRINLDNADEDPLDENISIEKGENKNVWEYKCDDEKPSDHPAFCSEIDKKAVKCNHDFTAKTVCIVIKDEYSKCYPRVELLENSCINEKAFRVILKNDSKIFKSSSFVQQRELFEVFNKSSRCYQDAESEKAYCLGTKILDSKTKQKTDFDNVKETSHFEIQVSYYDKNIYESIVINKNEKFFTIVENKTEINIKYPEIEFILQYNWNICPNDCNLKGFCVKSKCRCYTGFSGDACEVKDKEMKLFKIECATKILI